MKISMIIAMKKINSMLVRKYGEEFALYRLMAIGDVLYEYMDENEMISIEFYEFIMKNI